LTNSASGTTSVTNPQAVASTQAEPSLGQVQKAVQKINSSLTSQAQGIQFSIDSSSHRIVVEVVDQSNNTVIRQIPSKQALAIADSLDQSSPQGLLIKQQA
jgi:flagellar protein FlaG